MHTLANRQPWFQVYLAERIIPELIAVGVSKHHPSRILTTREGRAVLDDQIHRSLRNLPMSAQVIFPYQRAAHDILSPAEHPWMLETPFWRLSMQVSYPGRTYLFTVHSRKRTLSVIEKQDPLCACAIELCSSRFTMRVCVL